MNISKYCWILALVFCGCKDDVPLRGSNSDDKDYEIPIIPNYDRPGLSIITIECTRGDVIIHEYCPIDSESSVRRFFNVFLRKPAQEGSNQANEFLSFTYLGTEPVKAKIEEGGDILVFRISEFREVGSRGGSGAEIDLVRFPLSSIP